MDERSARRNQETGCQPSAGKVLISGCLVFLLVVVERPFVRRHRRRSSADRRTAGPYIGVIHVGSPRSRSGAMSANESAVGRYCCKSPKLLGDNFPAIRRSDRRPPICVVSIMLPRSPVSLSQAMRSPTSLHETRVCSRRIFDHQCKKSFAPASAKTRHSPHDCDIPNRSERLSPQGL